MHSKNVKNLKKSFFQHHSKRFLEVFFVSANHSKKLKCLTFIGGDAFSYSKFLENVNLSKSLTSAENDLFYGCSSLKQLTIPDSVKSFGKNKFDCCQNHYQQLVTRHSLEINCSAKSLSTIGF